MNETTSDYIKDSILYSIYQLDNSKNSVYGKPHFENIYIVQLDHRSRKKGAQNEKNLAICRKSCK
jgi:hypothetical protein